MRAAFDRRGLFVLLVAAFSVEGELLCRPGSSWYDGCNQIRCAGANLMGTVMYCSSEPDPSRFRCEAGSYWLWDQCNWCSCVDGKAICSRNICLPGSDGLEYLKLRELKDTKYELENMKCTWYSRWNDGCNNCSCSDDATPMCTYPDCHPKPDLSEYTCEVNSYWLTENDCNWCSCIDGKVFCTDAPCLPGTEQEEFFQASEQLARLLQHPGTKQEDYFQTSEQLARLLQHLDVKKCQPGPKENRWREGCNWCSCSSTGDKGCSKRSCSAADLKRLEGTRECEGLAVWKRKEEWCICVNGSAGCKKIDDEPPVREEL